MKLAIFAAYFAFTEFLFGNVNAQCEENQFACDDGTCIAIYDRCSGVSQCPDGSDERNCDNWQKDANYRSLARQENMQSDYSATKSSPKAPPGTSGTLLVSSFKWITIVSIMLLIGGFAVWLGLKHVRNKKPRGIRSGDIIDEDEDDLLISSMYAA